MALLLGLVILASYTLGVAGYRMVRDPGVTAPGLWYAEQGRQRTERTSLVKKLLLFLDRAVGGRVLGQMSSTSRGRVRDAIARAGAPDGITVEVLIQRQATWALLGGIAGAMLFLQGRPFGLVLPVLGWFFPRISLFLATRRRSAMIERELPDFLDVLAVTISAGLGFRAALRRVSTMVEGPVAEEMLIALRQIDVGASRRTAFQDLRERTTSKAMHNFVTSFLQAEELGIPLSGFLDAYSKELRRSAGQRARTAAAQANPKISLILTLVIMPAICLFMIGSLVLMAVLEST